MMQELGLVPRPGILDIRPYVGGEAKAAGVERRAIRDYIAANSIETVFGRFPVNETGQQTGYKYVATQWQGGV